MQKELYLFIIWQNGRFMEKQIIADLRKKFEIFRIFEVSWKEENFALNLARFYGKKLPKGCKKEKETGAGAFKVCLVFLFGKTVKDLEQEGPRAEICVVRRDLVGCPVWDSLQQALDTVRKIPFTRVKAYKNSYLIHSRNADLARRLLNASSHFSIPGIHKYSIEVGKTRQPIYIRKIN